jgi:hypothetical protein
LWISSGFLGFRRQFRDGGDGEADRRRDRGVRGILGTVADRGAGAARVSDGPSAGGVGGIRGTRAEGERGRRCPGFRRELIELSGKFGNTCDLLGGLFGAKNVGVTNLTHLK